MFNTTNKALTSIATNIKGEELRDVKLCVPDSLSATQSGIAREFAESVYNRRTGAVETEKASPEKVKGASFSKHFS
ncbi:MAG: hypothetical protein ACNI26_13185 [Terasakiella sp.]|uniref:hypothetical protein n=1 Tax=unclassified Terasakiella TaxID=2614952 RepID=UPI003AFFA798